MKVLHLLNSNRFSGAENVVCQIMGMFRLDSDMEMVYASPDGEIRKALQERNIRFVPITKMSLKEVKRVIRDECPSVIYAHDMRASVVAALVSGKIKMISHIHNNAFNARKVSLKSLLYLLAARKADHIFWVSEDALKDYRFSKQVCLKSSVLYNVIDVKELRKKMSLDQCSYDFDIVYVGRLTYQKNPERLIKVIRRIKDILPDVRVAIVGTGELMDEMKDLSKKNALEETIEFMGFLPNPLKIMHDSKVMLMTSRWEGTPMCALEAMALGVPMVVTPADGLKELVDHGVTGFISDDDSSLANYVVSLIQDDHLRERFSKNSVESAENINDMEKYKMEICRELYKNKQMKDNF